MPSRLWLPVSRASNVRLMLAEVDDNQVEVAADLLFRFFRE
jgi:hypothetical protein